MEEVELAAESRKLVLAIVYMSVFIVVLVVLGPDIMNGSSSTGHDNNSVKVSGLEHSQMAANSISAQ